ncbi:class IIb bacteriocin, lactobin A/cerein 7B family [Enterococcus plantarum]|uniref:class IIb bacteriocin, lactobin A/cerein 7B family n=1 Tax=Enterococcus plantarum TaxID=1077675 RepID=UPI0009F538C2|nr:class IIb bacteriocin, lactobin A/cerein 7B family [Enterococcus plantarum]
MEKYSGLELKDSDLEQIHGGWGFGVVVAIGGVFVAAYNAGYKFGSDLAKR